MELSCPIKQCAPQTSSSLAPSPSRGKAVGSSPRANAAVSLSPATKRAAAADNGRSRGGPCRRPPGHSQCLLPDWELRSLSSSQADGGWVCCLFSASAMRVLRSQVYKRWPDSVSKQNSDPHPAATWPGNQEGSTVTSRGRQPASSPSCLQEGRPPPPTIIQNANQQPLHPWPQMARTGVKMHNLPNSQPSPPAPPPAT